MRIILLLVFLCSSTLLAQNSKSSPVFIPLEDVDQAPVFRDCIIPEFSDCSLDRTTSFFVENLDEEFLRFLAPEETVVIIRFIVDIEGKVRSPNVQSKNEKLNASGIEVLKDLPEFKPGIHKGEKANVIIAIPLKIETGGPVSINSNLYDSPAMSVACKNSKDPKACTSKIVQEFFSTNIRDLNLKTEEEWLDSVVTFVIDIDGKVTEVTASGTNIDFNNEGIRVIKNLPKFLPATKDNIPIPMEFKLSFMIKTKQ